ncbi:site-specific integrase [Solihabitans fulvus]|uniref:site-specific integrase n=1 Tax=Solihabitans fulvus TaxID=1892852 RepID=UPI0016620057|nr:site-specific integrase [Solihabitans fulvus]
MARVRRLPITTSADVSRLVVSWLRGHPSQHTRSRYRRDLGRLAGWLLTHRGRGLLDARAEDIIAFARTRTGRQHDLDHQAHPLRRHNTIATQATAWSSFYGFCVRDGALEANPVAAARAVDAAAAYPPHPHNPARHLDASALRNLLVEAHRDPWLGGTLGAALVGLLLASTWRPERVTTRHLVDVLDQVDPATGRPTVRAGDEWAPLPEVVHDYLRTWIETERPSGRGPELFRDRSGLRLITAVDLMRLVNRCAARAELGDTITASQVARAARELAHRDIDLALPDLAELRRCAPVPEQLALPDDPRDYDSAEVGGQHALIPLPDNVVPLARRARRTRQVGSAGRQHTRR